MKIALDPYMIRHLSLPELCRATAELGYDQIELSPRSDFLDWWVMPRATKERMAAFKPYRYTQVCKLLILLRCGF